MVSRRGEARAAEDDIRLVLLDLSDALDRLRIPDGDGPSRRADRARRELMNLLDRDLIPRASGQLADVVAVTGPTGVGKSTLVNAIAGADVSTAGGLRPTTTAPVWVCGPGCADRVADLVAGPSDAVVRSADLMPDLALLDCPDPHAPGVDGDAVDRALSAARRWIAVTTVTRYADARFWDVLRRGVERGVDLAIVVNDRTGADHGAPREDLLAKLERSGWGHLPVRWGQVAPGSPLVQEVRDGLAHPDGGAEDEADGQALLDDVPRRVEQVVAGAVRSAQVAAAVHGAVAEQLQIARSQTAGALAAAVHEVGSVRRLQAAVPGRLERPDGGAGLREALSIRRRIAPLAADADVAAEPAMAAALDVAVRRLRDEVRDDVARAGGTLPQPLPARLDAPAAVRAWHESVDRWIALLAGQEDPWQHSDVPLDPRFGAALPRWSGPGPLLRGIAAVPKVVALCTRLEALSLAVEGVHRTGRLATGRRTSRAVVRAALGPAADEVVAAAATALAERIDGQLALVADQVLSTVADHPTTDQVDELRRAGNALHHVRG